MKLRARRCALAAAALAALAGNAQADEPPQAVRVVALGAAPKVDGDLAEWGSDGWTTVRVRPALDRKDRARYGLEEGDDHNQTGTLTVQLKAGVAAGRFFLAVRWPDAAEDNQAGGWDWNGSKYAAGRKRDDQFAVRFHLSGDFDRSMLSAKEYKVDVWLWSAARTNPTGIADDLHHAFTTRVTEDAAEYSLPDGRTIYIKRYRDAGTPPWRPLPAPRERQADRLPSFEPQKAAGSAGDVAALGRWSAGYWNLEFARAMSTGNADDVAFKPGHKLLGQIAVFNRGWAEHKSISEPLLFDFPPAR